MASIEHLEAYHRVQNKIKELQTLGKLQEAQQLIEVLEKLTAPKEEIKAVPEVIENLELKEISKLLKETIEEIRLLNEVKATASLTYENIKNEAVRKKLKIDNLRMEQSFYNINIPDSERFHIFCTNAFHQIENLLNYFYFIKFPDFRDCIKYFKDKGTVFDINYPPQRLSKIAANIKLVRFEKDFYYDPSGSSFYDSQLDLIREVRNLESHRCDVYIEEYDQIRIAYADLLYAIKNAKDKGFTYTKSKKDLKIEKDGKLAFFIKEQNFDLVRQELVILYEKVVSNLN